MALLVFFERWLVCWQKPNVPFVRLAKIVLNVRLQKNTFIGFLLSIPTFQFMTAVQIGLQITVWRLAKKRISKHYTVCQHKS
jgi:hypothetical protein